MPYAQDYIGIYKLVNKVTNECYVGQSQRVKKRINEHFRLLNAGKHTNSHLQNAFRKYGPDAFVGVIEIICEDLLDIDAIEEMFISGEASFPEPCVYNIADFAKAPMRGKKHTEATKAKIREALAKNTAHRAMRSDPEHRKKLVAGHLRNKMQDPKWLADTKFILDNDHMSYAERGRQVGKDTSTTRKLYLKYKHLKGAL
jgi:group I intron endonuclease